MQKHLESLFNCTSTGARVVKTEKGDYIVYDSPVYNYHLATLLQKTYPNMQISVNAEPSSLSGMLVFYLFTIKTNKKYTHRIYNTFTPVLHVQRDCLAQFVWGVVYRCGILAK